MTPPENLPPERSPLDREFDEFLEDNPAFAARIRACRARHREMGDELQPGGADEREVTIGDYRLLRRIGRGGMGVVHEARQLSMDRRVALKVLPPGLAEDERALARFLREARVAGSLHHPNVVSVHGMGVAEGTPWYSMELVDGETLAELLEELRAEDDPDAAAARRLFGLDECDLAHYAQVARLFAGVADGLQHAHEHGVVHRDVKPSNLILDRDGRLRILDFGLARIEGAEGLTATGDFLGTPLYMSPEQARAPGAPVDHHTDIYSFGAALYEMLAWRPPFRGKDNRDTLDRIVTRDPPPLRRINPRVPRDLETIVLKCLRKDPRDRYGTAEALAQDLRRFARGDPVEARPQSPLEKVGRAVWRRRRSVAAAVLAVLLLVTGGLFLLERHRSSIAATEREYEEKVLSAGRRVQLAKISLRERPGQYKSFEGFQFVRLGIISLGVENFRDQLLAAAEDLREAAALLPERPEARYYLARALELLERDEESQAIVDRIRAEHPHFAAGEELLERARRAAASRDWIEAARAYERLAEKERYLGSTVEAVLEAGLARLRAEDSTGALVDFAQARALAGPGAPEPAILLARTFHLAGDPERAEEEFDDLFARSESKARTALEIVTSYALLEDWERALEWTDLLEPEPLAARTRAVLLMQLDHGEDALAEAERAVELAPDDFRTHLTMAEAHERLGHFDEAVQSYREARRRNPADKWVLVQLGSLLVKRRGSLREGIEVLTEARRRYPTSAWIHRVLHTAHFYHLQRYEQSLPFAEEAVRLDPSHPESHMALGKSLGELGRFAEAHQAYDEALRVLPDFYAVYLYKGWTFAKEGKYEEAERDLKRAVELATGEARRLARYVCCAYLATALLHLGRDAEAHAAYEEAERSFRTFRHHRDAGWVPARFAEDGYKQLGRHEEALELFEEACRRNPRGLWYLHGAAGECEALGRFDDAVARYCRAIEAEPEYLYAYRKLTELFRREDVRLSSECIDGLLDALDGAARSAESFPAWFTILLRTLANAAPREKAPAPVDGARVFEICRAAVERSERRDPALLRLLGTLDARRGEDADAVLAFEEALDLPGSGHRFWAHEVAGEIEECRRRLGGDLPSYASIDAALRDAAREDIVAAGAEWRFLRGSSEPPPDWTGPDFDDASWERGAAPIGRGFGEVGTRLEDMEGSYTTVAARCRFDAPEPGRYARVRLSVLSDDGFVAFLNGAEMARWQAPGDRGPLARDAVAAAAALEPLAPVEVALDPGLLRPGTNVLAVQGLDVSLESSDFLLAPVLRGELSPAGTQLDDLLARFRREATGEKLEARAAYLEGRVLEIGGGLDQAAEKFRRALDQHPGYGEPALGLARCLRALGRSGEAEAALREALEKVPSVHRRSLRDAWLALSFVELERRPAEMLGDLPVRGEAVSWLLERLRDGEPIRINCGGEEYVSPREVRWSGDRFFAGGRRSNLAPQPLTHPFPDLIDATDDDPLYQTARWFPGNDSGPAGYRVPLPPGDYSVTLHFAEFSVEEEAARRFDVLLEGETVLASFEPLAAGFKTACSRTFPVSVRDGLLDIEFTYRSREPNLAALEIERR